nr:MAG TPA: type I neck protein [Caudoviricetes sp.]
MADFADMMETFGRNTEKLIPDYATKKAMTAAGAEILSKALQAETRTKHYQHTGKKGSKRKVKHLADSVAFENTDVNGIDNGNSVVGFQGKDESGINHARIARFINDGTIKMRGDHFVDNVRRATAPAVFAAEKKVYDAMGGGK